MFEFKGFYIILKSACCGALHIKPTPYQVHFLMRKALLYDLVRSTSNQTITLIMVFLYDRGPLVLFIGVFHFPHEIFIFPTL